MSLGYADRLKPKKNLGGQLGAQEFHQDFEDIRTGVKTLAKWVADAKRVFVFTGAGISTSCGIPDFRGPNGIWTLRKKGVPLPTDFTPFEYAKPSFTHMAISALVAAGKCPYVCSQNVDSMHLWSGVPRAQVAELHGNCFAERCVKCKAEYARDFQMETVDFKPSGRLCSAPGCGGALVDNILDWDTPLPQDELDEAVQQAEEADVSLVLGTSLQIQPANEIPVLTRDEGGKMVIVNLQKTPKDRRANLIIRSRVDAAMALLMQELGMQVPQYIRNEALVVDHVCSCSGGGGGSGGANGGAAAAAGARVLTVTVGSQHGPSCPLPIVESLQISVCSDDSHDRGASPGGSGRGDGGDGGASSSGRGAEPAPVWGPESSGVLKAASGGSGGGVSHSFSGVPAWVRQVRCTLAVRLVKYADEDKRDVTLHHTVDLGQITAMSKVDGPPNHINSGSAAPAASGSQVRHSFVSQSIVYDPASVVAAFLADPPPVVMPDPPKKRQKKDPSPAPAPTRVSARRASRTSQRAAYPSESSGAASSNEDGDDNDDSASH